MLIETGEANPDHSPTFEDIAAQVIVIHIEATLDHNTEIDATTTGAAHDDLALPTEDTATDLTMTHHTGHITDHPNIKPLQVINPKITVDCIHDHPTDLPRHEPCRSDSYSSRMRRRPQKEEHESEN